MVSMASELEILNVIASDCAWQCFLPQVTVVD
jgi:hypothetical protein